MAVSEFTSGPLRDLSARELGASGFSDFELLSDSGHNRVYRAMSDGKWVVLKVAKEEEGNTARNRSLLQREYDIMHALDCLYVVKTWQMTDVPDLGTAIIMEYVAGRTLERFVQENPSLSERRRVAAELMEALAFLHERQIVHGNLKPSNILITDSGNHVRLIDFGFSDNEAYVAKNIGTSPSISTNEQLPTDVLLPERDIYALGKTLALLFPHSAKPVIRRCLASDRSRYTSVRQVRAALHRYWRMRWLLPLFLAIAAIVAFVIAFLPSPKETAQISEIQTDTVVLVVPTEPAVDSVWLDVKSRAEQQYSTLYRTYADSLKNMPVKCLDEGILMNGRYATKVWKVYNQAATSYPQYAEQLYDQYLFIYDRDYKRLADIYKDYPVILR